jgi:hypothetical protein
MKTLPYDVSRCCGFEAFGDEKLKGEWCPERKTCQRYLAWAEWDKEVGVPDYKGIPVTMARRDCEIKIQLLEE